MSDSEGYDHIFLEIGTIGHFSPDDAAKAALAFRLARAQSPQATVGFFVGGYDEDPREIYDIPEAVAYIRRWAKLAGLRLARSGDAAMGAGSLSRYPAAVRRVRRGQPDQGQYSDGFAEMSKRPWDMPRGKGYVIL